MSVDTEYSKGDFQPRDSIADEDVKYGGIASATVIEKGDAIALSSGLIIKATASSAKIGIALAASADGDTDDVPFTTKGVWKGKADAVFAVTHRGAEVDLVILPGYMETGVVEATVAELIAVTNGSFRITIDGTAYNVDAIDLSSGTPTTYAAIAALLQTALQTATSGSQTVTYSTTTGRFKFASVTAAETAKVSALSTSTGTVGTDISGVAYLNGASGNALITNPRQAIDVGSSSTDVFKVEPGTNAGTVGDQQDVLVTINKPI